MNSSGRVFVIFIVIIAILLISLTAISMFFFKKEVEKRELAEAALARHVTQLKTVKKELEDLQGQKFLLEEKNKEADERINSLLDELELQEGIRAETKKENISLKEQVENLTEENDKMKEQLAKGTQEYDQKIVSLKENLQKEIQSKKEIQEQLKTAEKTNKKLSEEISLLEGDISQDLILDKDIVHLDKIVVSPADALAGRILTVDKETEFVIVNLGMKDGVQVGSLMAVYRGKDYLGDIRVTRVQPEMSAADLLPPFSSRLVRKNDQVIVKQ